MNTISKETLKARLERREPLQLVMALGHWAFEQAHIPGSLNFENISEAARYLSRDEEVVLYCTSPACPASYRAYYELKGKVLIKSPVTPEGSRNRIAAGYPAEGSLVRETTWAVA